MCPVENLKKEFLFVLLDTYVSYGFFSLSSIRLTCLNRILQYNMQARDVPSFALLDFQMLWL